MPHARWNLLMHGFDYSWGNDGDGGRWPELPEAYAIGPTVLHCGCGHRDSVDSKHLFEHGWDCPGCAKHLPGRQELTERQHQKWQRRYAGRVGRGT